MPKTDQFETELLADYENGALKSVATRSELSKFKASARATAIKDRRGNIRLSSGDLQDILRWSQTHSKELHLCQK
jgi:predicted DNA binding CopG/RHH family protein